jgi:uncharacterized protein YgbK (DUF1537 family)
MIVIADDLTGAAEIAGICLRFGLQATISLNGQLPSRHGVSIFCTDTRSMKSEEAKQVTTALMKEIGSRPVFFKKIDSVCRGHVLDELKIEMKAAGKQRAIVLPANPSLGRAINNGKYYINGVPVNETGFAHDPEFPMQSALLTDMLHAKDISVLKHTDPLPEHGIVVGEAISETDIEAWAHKAGADDVLAGAGDFFTALLQLDCQIAEQCKPEIESPFLYISGTAFNESRKFVNSIRKKKDIVVYLPIEDNDENWFATIHAVLAKNNKAIIAIDPAIGDAIPPESLRSIMARRVKEILQRETIKELFIEGGATAAAILQQLGIDSLATECEWERGVVRMKANDWLINFKPGSYQLPAAIKEFISH